MRTYSVRSVCHAAPLNDGLLWIGNTSSSLALSILEIMALPAGGGASVVDTNFDMPRLAGKQQFARVTAYTGGTPVGFVAHRSSATAMPAQVMAVGNADSVTVASTLRQLVDGTYYSSTNNTTGVLAMTMRYPMGRRGRGKQRSQATLWGSGDSTVEPIVLAEGEGLALIQAAFFIPEPRVYRFTLRDTATGATYQAAVKAMPAAQTNEAVALVFNGTGSGVTLAVEGVELEALGEYWGSIATRVSPGPWVRIAWCDRVRTQFANDPSQGALVPVPHRSDAPLPSGAVSVVRGPLQPMLPSNEASQLSPPAELYETHGTQPTVDTVNMRQQIMRDVLRFWRAPAYGKNASAASYLPNAGARTHCRNGEGTAWTTRGSVNVDPIVLPPGRGLVIAAHMAPWILSTSTPDGTSTTVYDLTVTFGLQPQPGASPRLPRIQA